MNMNFEFNLFNVIILIINIALIAIYVLNSIKLTKLRKNYSDFMEADGVTTRPRRNNELGRMGFLTRDEFEKLEKNKVPHDIAMEKLYNMHSELSKAVIDNAINNGADLEF